MNTLSIQLRNCGDLLGGRTMESLSNSDKMLFNSCILGDIQGVTDHCPLPPGGNVNLRIQGDSMEPHLYQPQLMRATHLWSPAGNGRNVMDHFSCQFNHFRNIIVFLPTQSTGPQPIQLVPKHCFLQISISVARIKKIQKTKNV